MVKIVTNSDWLYSLWWGHERRGGQVSTWSAARREKAKYWMESKPDPMEWKSKGLPSSISLSQILLQLGFS